MFEFALLLESVVLLVELEFGSLFDVDALVFAELRDLDDLLVGLNSDEGDVVELVE